MLLLMIGAFLWVMEKEGRPLIQDAEKESVRQTGEASMAVLTEYLDQASSLALFMAQTAEALPLDQKLYTSVFSQALNTHSIRDFVAGGGIWPEPFAFNKNKARFSFFWGKDEHGKLQLFDDYNRPDGLGYHEEEWYVPAKYVDSGSVYWSRSYVDPYTLEPMITATAPIYRDGELFGVSTVDVMLSALKELLSKQAEQFGGYAYVLDRSGVFLSFPDDVISKRRVITEKNSEKLQYVTIQKASESTPFLPNIDDALSDMESISRSNRGLSRIAQKLAQESYQISIDEGFRIASIMADPLAEKNIGSSFIKHMELPSDPILKEPVEIQIFHIPDIYGKLILVIPKRLLNVKSDDIVQAVLWGFSWTILLSLIVGLLCLEWILIAPLKRMRQQVMNFDHSHLISDVQSGELGDLAAQFNKRNQQLLDLNDSLSDSYIRAKQASQAKSQFLANMSHEIRTPLNGVMGMIDIVLRKNLPEKEKHFLEVAKSSSASLLTLINDILDFSKVESGKLEIQSIDFNLRNLLSEIVDTIRHVNANEDVEIILDLNALDSNWVKGDPNRLRQIFTNLIANALKFTDQGEVLIKVGLKDISNLGFILYGSVRDTGIGIDEEKTDELFESFTQADFSSTRQYGGTGLGLAICKKLCELMNGSISVSSEIGKGSCFEFTILLEKSEFDFKSKSNVELADLNILVADDNESNRLVISELLDIWQVNVTSCSSGEDALNKVIDSNLEFDLVIIDMEMPGLDGGEVGREIRAVEKLDDVPLILMSSFDESQAMSHIAAVGFQAYLLKPILPEDLHDAITLCLERDPVVHQAKPILTTQHIQALRISESQEDKQHVIFEGRILLVEDNPINQEVALNMLNDFGLKVDVANDGIEALDQLQKGIIYNLIFMDCQMPNMDGYDATRAIRGLNQFKQIPIIAMTANALQGDKEKCLKAGMDDYLAKPINFDRIQSIIEKWLK